MGVPAAQDAVEIQAVDLVGGHVGPLVEDELGLLPGGLEGVVHQVKLLGPHVEVVEAVDDEGGAVQVVRPVGVVALVPEEVVVAGEGVLGAHHAAEIALVVQLDGGVVPAVQLPGHAVVGQNVAVVAGVVQPARRGALGAVVVVPAGDARPGHDGLEALHPGGGHGKGGGAGVGLAGHGHIAVRPVGLHLHPGGLVGKGLHALVPGQPLYHCGEGGGLVGAGAGLKPVGAQGAGAGAGHVGVAPHQPVVVGVHILGGLPHVAAVPRRAGAGDSLGGGRLGLPGLGRPVPVGLGGSGGLLGLGELGVHNVGVPGVQVVGVGAAGGVGPGLIDGGRLHPLVGGGGPLDEHLYQVGLAVAVGVHRSLYVHHFPNDGVIGEDGLGLAVHKQGSGGVPLDDLFVPGGQLRHLLQPRLGEGSAGGQAQVLRQSGVVAGPGADLPAGEPRPPQQNGGRLQGGGGLLGLELSAAGALH